MTNPTVTHRLEYGPHMNSSYIKFSAIAFRVGHPCGNPKGARFTSFEVTDAAES